ncbi:MAG: glycosyltransferase family 2 protein [Deltaproteobacteria bacterium]|nr:glycosyltransferase family 2 protein [Deltaproteobacteria bacterium]
MSPRLSLVIPCFNEAGNLPALVSACVKLVAAADAEVVLVENGSSDGSADVLTTLTRPHRAVRAVMLQSNAGYGGGILAGLRAARGSLLGWTHADLQTDPADCLRALPLFDAEPEAFVKGQRGGRPLRDVVFTWGMAAFEAAVLGVRMWDINAQPTLFTRAFFATWEDPPTDFSLDLFAYHEALRRGLPVRRVPVHFGERGAGEGNNDTLRGKLNTSRRTAAYSLALRRHLRARP